MENVVSSLALKRSQKVYKQLLQLDESVDILYRTLSQSVVEQHMEYLEHLIQGKLTFIKQCSLFTKGYEGTTKCENSIDNRMIGDEPIVEESKDKEHTFVERLL